jgi:hypothetical protein
MSGSDKSRLDEISERVLAADAPPWTIAPVRQEGKPPSWTKVYGPRMKQCEFDAWGPKAEENARFLAHAREDVPWLLTLVAELKAEISNLEADRLDRGI